MRQDMLSQMREWVDGIISTQIIGAFAAGEASDGQNVTATGSSTAAAAATNSVSFSIATGEPTAKGTGSVTNFDKSFFDWIKSLELKLALLNASPAIAAGDSYDLIVVMCPQFYASLYNYILETYKNNDILIREMLSQAMSILNGPQYQSTLFSRRLYTTGASNMQAIEATDGSNAAGFTALALAVGEKAAYDTALIDIGGVKYNPPDANSAKHKLRMEIELAHETIEGKGQYMFRAGAVA